MKVVPVSHVKFTTTLYDNSCLTEKTQSQKLCRQHKLFSFTGFIRLHVLLRHNGQSWTSFDDTQMNLSIALPAISLKLYRHNHCYCIPVGAKQGIVDEWSVEGLCDRPTVDWYNYDETVCLHVPYLSVSELWAFASNQILEYFKFFSVKVCTWEVKVYISQ